MKKIIFVASPLKGNYCKNIKAAKKYCQYVCEQGHIPYAPHLLFPQFLPEKKGKNRNIGMKMGLEMLKICDELWLFGDLLSEGMMIEFRVAKERSMPITRFNSEYTIFERHNYE